MNEQSLLVHGSYTRVSKVGMFSTEPSNINIWKSPPSLHSPFLTKESILLLPRELIPWMQHPGKRRVLWFLYLVSTSSITLYLGPLLCLRSWSILFLVQFYQWLNLLPYFKTEEELSHGCGRNLGDQLLTQNFNYLLFPFSVILITSNSWAVPGS